MGFNSYGLRSRTGAGFASEAGQRCVSLLLVEFVGVYVETIQMPKETFKFFHLLWKNVVPHLEYRTVSPEIPFFSPVVKQTAFCSCLVTAGHSDIDDIHLLLASAFLVQHIDTTHE